jgi:hypothetical protein
MPCMPSLARVMPAISVFVMLVSFRNTQNSQPSLRA